MFIKRATNDGLRLPCVVAPDKSFLIVSVTALKKAVGGCGHGFPELIVRAKLTAIFGKLRLQSLVCWLQPFKRWVKKVVKPLMLNDGTIPCANDWLALSAKRALFPNRMNIMKFFSNCIYMNTI